MKRTSRTGRRGARALPALACSLALFLSATSFAQPAAAPEAQSRLDQAKALFRSGVAVKDAGDVERALDYFVRSHDLYPSPQNTINAALCLTELARYDEALELYESALATLGDQLDPDDRAAIARATPLLMARIGSVDVTSNATGAVLVDGRARGKLPLLGPIRLLPGKHVVRVLKDGYATFETQVVVVAGARVAVDAKLEPLAAAGQLRVEDPASDGAQIVVDGVTVGAAPWEGTLGPGAHVIASRNGDVGSAPTSVIVLQGQTALVRLKSGPLGPVARIDAEPPTAAITLGGVPVGAGKIELRLPAGEYDAEAREPGYFPASAHLVVGAPDAAPLKVQLALAVDPNDPRWPRPVVRVVPPLGRFWAGLFGGPALGATFASSAEAGCPDRCPNASGVFGPALGARVGFRFRFGLSVEVSGSYWAMSLSSERIRTGVFPTNAPAYTVRYDLHDELHYSGALPAIGVSHVIPVKPWISIVPRATVGVFVGRVRNPVTGTASTDAGAVPVQIEGAGDSVSATRVVLVPEIGALFPWKGLELGAALGIAFFPGVGPTFSQSQLQIAPSCSPANPGAVGCAPSSTILANERALGAFFLWMPQVSVAYPF